jgi:hypothetical protein
LGNSWNDKPGTPAGSGIADAILWGVHQQNGGQYSPVLKGISDGLQTVNQSVSALSTSTNTKLQFQSEQYKQGLGILSDLEQGVEKEMAKYIQGQQQS